MTVFETTVVFYAEDQEFGSETYLIAAHDELAAEECALKLSEGSRYFDDRIDFTRATDANDAGFDADNAPDGVNIMHAEASITAAMTP